MQAVANHYDTVEGKAGFGTVPSDELIDGVLVPTARGWRAEAIEHGQLAVIQIRQAKHPATVCAVVLILRHGRPIPRDGLLLRFPTVVGIAKSRVTLIDSLAVGF